LRSTTAAQTGYMSALFANLCQARPLFDVFGLLSVCP
jgi:hypothetical protein